MSNGIKFLIFLLLITFWGLTVFAVKNGAGAEEPKKKFERKRLLAKEADPDEEQLFVWARPDAGPQSLLVLDIIDDNTVEAAYLVPVVVKLKKGAPKATLEKLIVGKLLQFKLSGAKGSTLTGDIWLGKKDRWLSEKK